MSGRAGYTLGLLFALLLMVALWQLGVRVVLPLSLAGASQEERATRLARFNSTVLSRALLVLYLVRAGSAAQLRVYPAASRAALSALPGVSRRVGRKCVQLALLRFASQQPALTQLPPRTTSFRDLQLHHGTRYHKALLVLLTHVADAVPAARSLTTAPHIWMRT